MNTTSVHLSPIFIAATIASILEALWWPWIISKAFSENSLSKNSMMGTFSPAEADFPNSSLMALASKPRAVKASIFLEPFGGKRLRILCCNSARKSDIRIPALKFLSSADTRKLYQLRIFYFFRLILGGLLMSPSVEYLSSSVPLGIRMVRIIPPSEFFGYLGSLDINQLSHQTNASRGSFRIWTASSPDNARLLATKACPSLPIPEDTPFELPGTHDFHQQCCTDLQVVTLALLAFRSPSLELWPTRAKT